MGSQNKLNGWIRAREMLNAYRRNYNCEIIKIFNKLLVKFALLKMANFREIKSRNTPY